MLGTGRGQEVGDRNASVRRREPALVTRWKKTLKFGSFQKIRALFVDVARLKRTVAAKCLRTARVRFTFLAVSVVITCRSSEQTNNRAHTNNKGPSRMIYDLSLS